ncbi:MAG: sensor histidine kinase [Spirochaetaceae bacterium]
MSSSQERSIPFLEEMLSLAPVGVFRSRSTGEALFFNQKMADMLHFATPEEAVAYYQDLPNQLYQDPNHRANLIKELKEHGRVENFVAPAKRRDGSKLWIEISARVSRWESSSLFLLEGYVTDISARHQAEELLAEREQRYRKVVESSPNAIFTTDSSGYVRDFNSAAEQLFGFSRSTTINKHYTELLEPDEFTEGLDRMFQSVLGGASFSGIDLVFRRADGRRCYTLSRLYPVQDLQGQVSGVVFANTDITQRRTVELQLKEREEHLQRLNKEKETLLLEIHHRVKNNLQAIVSLLNLQQGYVRDPEDAELFAQSADRVRSMALVHEQLYQSSSYAQIAFSHYIETLLHELEAAQSDGRSFDFTFDLEPLTLDLNRAIPCGLVINELVSNAIKHNRGRPDRISIHISLRKRNSTVEVEVSNDGATLPDGFDLHRGQGLGLTLVESLAAQLGGTVEAIRKDRTIFRLTFPL